MNTKNLVKLAGVSSIACLLSWGQVQAQAPNAATGAPATASAPASSAQTLVISPPGRPGSGESQELLVREINSPALQPFRAAAVVANDTVNKQTQVTTVPEGKRLIIESANWLGTNLIPAEVIFAGLRIGQFGPFVQYLQINPAHAAATPGFTLQDGIQQGPVYLEAGDELWLSVSKSQADAATFELRLNGHFIDVP